MRVGCRFRGFASPGHTADLSNTCWTRRIYGETGTLLVMCQANDLELEQHEPVLWAICASLKEEED